MPHQILDVGQIDSAVAVCVRDLGDLYLVGLRLGCTLGHSLHIKQGELFASDRAAGVAGGDELLQAKMVEVHGEELEEVGLVGVVAVAEHHLAAELVPVVPELGLDVDQLGVELVVLGPVRPD